jgi:hypothetical protein
MSTLYRLLTEDDTSDFCHKVTLALSKGWDLYGDPQYAFDQSSGKMRCAQAVIKQVEAQVCARHETRRAIMTKTNPGRFFEDYSIGQVIDHAVHVPFQVGNARSIMRYILRAMPCILLMNLRAGVVLRNLRLMIWRHSMWCSGKTVPDVSLNAVANLGYAEGRWILPVYEGDTLRSRSTVIGLKQNSNGKTGVVYVRTQGA